MAEACHKQGQKMEIGTDQETTKEHSYYGKIIGKSATEECSVNTAQSTNTSWEYLDLV